MKYLIVGASGFLGGTMLNVLGEAGHEVWGTFATKPHAGLIPFDLRSDRIDDRLPPELALAESEKCAVVCACVCQVDRCYRQRDVTRLINVDNTIRLLSDLRHRGFRVVFISTGHVFDGRVGYYREDEQRSPIHEYGRHKAAVEDWIEAEAPDTMVLRPGKLVSNHADDSNMFSEWLRDARAGRPITCIAEQVLAPTLAADVARALDVAQQARFTGTYHVSNTEFFVRNELAQQFLRALGFKTPVIVRRQDEFNFAEPRPLLDYLDSTKFLRATNFRFTSASEVFACLKAQCKA